MNTEGDFGKFTELMRKVVRLHPSKAEKKPKASSSFHAPAAS
jgi:hypothetical protein